MGHFNLKSLTFYGVMIGSVLALFNVVTAYGEHNLKAPVKISGNYQISSQNLPDCLRSENITLAIAQSGIYVAGKLVFSPKIVAQEKLPDTKQSSGIEPTLVDSKTIKLNGLMQSQPFTLTGNTEQLGSCLLGNSPASDAIALKIERQVGSLSGQLNWSTLALTFTGQKLEATTSER